MYNFDLVVDKSGSGSLNNKGEFQMIIKSYAKALLIRSKLFMKMNNDTLVCEFYCWNILEQVLAKGREHGMPNG